MSSNQLSARLDGLIDKHIDAITKLVDAVLEPHLDPLKACREADAISYVLRASTTMLEELYRQLAREMKQAAERAH